MAVASLDHGVAAKCNMMTGKVDRHLLYSTNDHIRLQITAVKVDKDRIIWGFGHGYITVSTRTNSVSSRLKVFSDFHQGPVKLLALPTFSQEVVLSGAQDGQVKIWDLTTTSSAWTLFPTSSLAREPTVIETTNDQHLIIGYDDGSIVIWTMNLYQLTQLNRSMGTDDYMEKRNNFKKDLEKKKIDIHGNGNAVKFISYDTETSTFLVTYVNETNVSKYNINTGQRVALFENGHNAGTSITCMQWDQSTMSPIVSLESALNPRPTTRKKKVGVISLSSTASTTTSPSSSSSIGTPKYERRARLLVTGDDLGTICLWNADDNGTVKPIRVLSGHLVGISSIYIDACKIVTGSDDGWIRMWNPLTGENINTLGNKIPKGAAVDRSDIDMMQVKNIWCNDYQGVATIGHQVKCWDFSVGKQFLNHALKQKTKVCGGGNMNREKFRYEVKESLKKFETEKMEIEKEKKQIDKLSLGGLSNDEMLDYALMLSAQEEEQAYQPVSAEDEDEALLRAVIASLELTENTSSDTSSAISQSDDWPTPSTRLSRSPQTEEEELRYILELSKTEQ